MLQITSILVLGAGELGREVISSVAALREVRDSVASLTVALRPSTTSTTSDVKTFEELGAKIIRHDVAALDAGQLAQILQPFDAVISCLGFSAGPGVQMKIAQAALQACVKRFFPWQFGVDYDVIGRGSGQTLFDEQLDVRDMLRAQSDVDWVIVSTGIFMSFVFEDLFGVVQGAKDNAPSPIWVHALGSWDHGLSATDVKDIGRLTAAILVDGSIRQQVVHVSGDSFTYDKLADALARTLKRDVHRELWSQEHLKQELAKDPEDTIAKYRVAFASNKGVVWPQTFTYNVQNNIPAIGLEQYIAENIKPR